MVILKTDGLSKGNPGRAAFAFLVLNSDGSTLSGGGGRLGIQTNNYAEYMGVVAGLKYCSSTNLIDIQVQTDSKLIVGHLNEGWEVKALTLKPLVAKVRLLIVRINSMGGEVSISWIPRLQNQDADFLANEILFKGASQVLVERGWKQEVHDGSF